MEGLLLESFLSTIMDEEMKTRFVRTAEDEADFEKFYKEDEEAFQHDRETLISSLPDRLKTISADDKYVWPVHAAVVLTCSGNA
jgi:hypothetical protein